MSSMQDSNAKAAMEVARKSALQTLADLHKKIEQKHKHADVDWSQAGDMLHWLQQLARINSEIK